MKRVIVTGATGFIGRHAIPALLRRGYEVHALTRAGETRTGGVTWHSVDLLAGEPLQALFGRIRAGHLLHLSWCTDPGQYWTSAANLRWVKASIDLLAGFKEAGGERFVGVGSCAEYDWRYGGYCVENVTPAHPASLYGVSKDCVRRLLESYAVRSGMGWAWGRVFHLYGPGEHPGRLVSSVIRGLLDGREVPCTHGTQLRDYLHVIDVASALVALLDSAIEGPVNIASDQPVSLRDLLKEIGVVTGRGELVRLGALAAPAEEPDFLVGSNQRLAKEVAWIPEYDLQRGVRQTVGWWKEQREGVK